MKTISPIEEDSNNYMNDLIKSAEALNNASNAMLNLKPTKDDINVFKNLITFIEKFNTVSANKFANIIKSKEPVIETRRDVVQKSMIISIIVEQLFIFKCNNEKENIVPILAVIPYDIAIDPWLKIMYTVVIPFLLNNKII